MFLSNALIQFRTISYKFFQGNKTTKICGSKNIACYLMAEMILFGGLAIDDDLNTGFSGVFRERCNCLQACTSIQYGVSIDRAKLNFVEAQKARNISFIETKG